MSFLEHIEIRPDVMLGKPVIRGTRIPVDLLVRKLGEGASEEQLLDAYPRLEREAFRQPCSTPQRFSLTTRRFFSNFHHQKASR